MKKVSLYANIDYFCYIIRNQPNNESALFQEDTHNYYNGGFTGAYYTSLFHRPLILSTIVSVDASAIGLVSPLNVLYITMLATWQVLNDFKNQSNLGSSCRGSMVNESN